MIRDLVYIYSDIFLFAGIAAEAAPAIPYQNVENELASKLVNYQSVNGLKVDDAVTLFYMAI